MKTICYDGSTIETIYSPSADRYQSWHFPKTGPGTVLRSMWGSDESVNDEGQLVSVEILDDSDEVAEMHRDAWREYNANQLRLEPKEINVR